MFLFNTALSMLTAAVSGAMLFLAIPVSQFWDVLFYHKVYTVFEIIGVSLIFAANLVLSILKGKGII